MVLILKEGSDQILGSPQKPTGDQGCSLRVEPQPLACLPKPQLLLQSPHSAEEKWGPDSVLTGTPHLFVHWKGCLRPLILFTSDPCKHRLTLL